MSNLFSNDIKILSIKDIKELTNISHKSITKAIASGQLKSKKKSGKYQILYEDYLVWKQNNFPLEDIIDVKIENKKRDILINEIDIKDDFFTNEKKHRSFTFIDVFAGAGGISLGLSMAGGKGICGLEIMPEACETYKYNFNHPILNEDITQKKSKEKLYQKVKEYFNTNDIKGKVDVISGGFPCQGFSMAGNRVVDDERNSLYKELKEIVETLKPKFILMENVPGLRTMLNGKVEEKILQDFEEIGYKIQVKILNSADYGVPQIRKRVIFIGNRIDKTNYHPKPIYQSHEYKTVYDAIADLQDKDKEFCENHIFTKHKPEMIERLRAIEPGKSLYKNFSDAWKKIEWNRPSCTIKENHGGVNVHPEQGRVITPREMARLQSFPDNFKFKGSKKWQLVQLGNAVPPLMAKAIGLAISKSLQ